MWKLFTDFLSPRDLDCVFNLIKPPWGSRKATFIPWKAWIWSVFSQFWPYLIPYSWLSLLLLLPPRLYTRLKISGEGEWLLVFTALSPDWQMLTEWMQPIFGSRSISLSLFLFLLGSLFVIQCLLQFCLLIIVFSQLYSLPCPQIHMEKSGKIQYTVKGRYATHF